MTSDKTKTIRAALKTELGLNSRQVSVRTPHWGSINVEIKDPTANFAAVEAIANREERIHRCEITRDILSGGNTFVWVRWSEAALKTRGAPWVEKVREAEKALRARFAETGKSSTLETITDEISIGLDDHGHSMNLWGGSRHRCAYMNDAESVAAQIPCLIETIAREDAEREAYEKAESAS